MNEIRVSGGKFWPAVLEVVFQLAGREQIITAKALFARNALEGVFGQIDSWMNNARHSR